MVEGGGVCGAAWLLLPLEAVRPPLGEETEGEADVADGEGAAAAGG